ncbi:MAG: hypothetical protein K1000chlam2_01227 [Chlamydiae bacterium]|nr:hypothetical protein [Chlamydiota bacterium]
MEILKDRYPDIGFFLSFFPHEKVELSTDSKPFETWLKCQNLEQVDVLYVIGLIGFALPKSVSMWLKEKKERALVFIEEDLGAFAAFSDRSLIENPQIHLHYAKEDPIEVLAGQFPTDRLAIFEGKSFDVLGLQRKSAALSALYSDVLYSHQIVENVLSNFQRLSMCFDARGSFKNVPAIICGAGPSLEKSLSTLKNTGDQALIFAGGSAITALSKQGVRPHFAIALDPNEEEWDRLSQALYFEGPFLFAPRLHRNVFATANGPFGYLKTDTGGLVENWLEKQLGMDQEPVGPDLGSEAFSVTTLAISYAFALGCNPIILTGVDLAYSGGVRYAGGIDADVSDREDPRALEKVLSRHDIYGEKVETLLKWVMESECISAFAKNHPKVSFLNASEGGIGFKGIKNVTLSKSLKGTKTRDLSGEIHQWIQESPMELDQNQLSGLLVDLGNSLKRADALCVAILQELEKKLSSGKLVLYQADLEEELAYGCLLEGIDSALDHLLIRYFPHLDQERAKWEREVAKYRELRRQIGMFRDLRARKEIT